MIHFHGRTLAIGAKEILFEFEVSHAKELPNGNILVILRIPLVESVSIHEQMNESNERNVYVYDRKGTQIWRIEDVTTKYPKFLKAPYEEAFVDKNKLIVFDAFGHRVTVDVQDGSVLEATFVS